MLPGALRYLHRAQGARGSTLPGRTKRAVLETTETPQLADHEVKNTRLSTTVPLDWLEIFIEWLARECLLNYLSFLRIGQVYICRFLIYLLSRLYPEA